MASATYSLGLTRGIGIGVAIGFVAALVLTAISVWSLFTYRLKVLQKAVATIKPGYCFPEPERPTYRPPWPSAFFRDGRTNLAKQHYKDVPGTRLRALTTRGCVDECVGKDITAALGIWEFTHQFIEDDPSSYHQDASESSIKALLNEDELTRLAGKPVNDGTWTELISNLKTRHGAIACFISQVLIPRMHITGDISKTFLPQQLVSYYRVLTEFNPEWRLYGDCGSGNYWDLLSVFREVVVSLYYAEFAINPAYGYRTFGRLAEDPRSEMVTSLRDDIFNTLHLDKMERFGSYPEALKERLRHRIEWAANAAIVLFAQPGEWLFSWDSDEPGS